GVSRPVLDSTWFSIGVVLQYIIGATTNEVVHMLGSHGGRDQSDHASPLEPQLQKTNYPHGPRLSPRPRGRALPSAREGNGKLWLATSGANYLDTHPPTRAVAHALCLDLSASMQRKGEHQLARGRTREHQLARSRTRPARTKPESGAHGMNRVIGLLILLVA